MYWYFNVNHQFRIVFLVLSFCLFTSGAGASFGLSSVWAFIIDLRVPSSNWWTNTRDQFYTHRPQWHCSDVIVLTLSLLSWSCSMNFIFRSVSSSFLSSWRRLNIVDECFYSIPAHKNKMSLVCFTTGHDLRIKTQTCNAIALYELQITFKQCWISLVRSNRRCIL